MATRQPAPSPRSRLEQRWRALQQRLDPVSDRIVGTGKSVELVSLANEIRTLSQQATAVSDVAQIEQLLRRCEQLTIKIEQLLATR